MNSAGIPDDVLAFVAEHIDTVPQLETLLLLRANEERGWSAEELASRVYVSISAMREILRSLQRAHLIVEDEKSVLNRYQPDSEVMRDRVTQVANEYRRHLVQIATLIHSKASPAVREFARAFDLKKSR
jgi:hypothetical protein